jgi:hypothetical protein
MANRKIAKMLCTAEQRMDEAFKEIIEATDLYNADAGIEFICGSDASPGCTLKEGNSWFFRSPFENWLRAFNPRCDFILNRMEAGRELEDDRANLAFDALDFGYMLGFLVGTRTQGASESELRVKFECFKKKMLSWANTTFEHELDRKKKPKKEKSEQLSESAAERKSDGNRLLTHLKSMPAEKYFGLRREVFKYFAKSNPNRNRLGQPDLKIVWREG